MSPSDEAAKLSNLLAELRAQIERTIEAGEITSLRWEDVTDFVSCAAKVYTAAVEEAESEVPVIDSSVSPTEAMVVACALLRAHHLNPFDLALWFARTAPRGDTSGG